MARSRLYTNSATGQIVTSRTELERMLKAYQSTVERLIQMPSFSGLSAEALAAFKTGHAFSAYTCRIPGCTWATVGFQNDTVRCDHEMKHTQKLKCTVPDCSYDVPFPSTKSLNSHHKKYHTPPLNSKAAQVTWMKGSCLPCKESMVLCDRTKPYCKYFRDQAMERSRVQVFWDRLVGFQISEKSEKKF